MYTCTQSPAAISEQARPDRTFTICARVFFYRSRSIIFFFYYRRISRIPVLSLPRLGLVRHHRRARNFFTNLDKYIYIVAELDDETRV